MIVQCMERSLIYELSAKIQFLTKLINNWLIKLGWFQWQGKHVQNSEQKSTGGRERMAQIIYNSEDVPKGWEPLLPIL